MWRSPVTEWRYVWYGNPMVSVRDKDDNLLRHFAVCEGIGSAREFTDIAAEHEYAAFLASTGRTFPEYKEEIEESIQAALLEWSTQE